jgi:glycosyltransferase involved in cell wall biosynthesis
VLVVPHVVTPFTDSLDPIKLYEYQAAGRPVVSTPVGGFRDVDDDHVTVVEAEDFPAAVVSLVDSASGGRGVSAPHADAERLDAIDWSRRVDQMAAILTRLRAGGSA